MRGETESRDFRWLHILLVSAAVPLWATGDYAQSTQVGKVNPSRDSWIDQNLDELLPIYTQLHRHPELSYQENETARLLAAELSKTGAEVTTGVGKLGVVGVLKNGAGPVVLVRTDMDALPVVEETGLTYRSET